MLAQVLDNTITQFQNPPKETLIISKHAVAKDEQLIRQITV